MRFNASSEHYDRFMGRYTPSLAVALADFADVKPGTRALDVGCGPGGLATELAVRVAGANVAAIDPAPQFVAACRRRVPDADVRVGTAEALPWAAGSFDVALSSLVIGFMTDPDLGIREMARVVRPGGTVAACMWDIASGGMTMLHLFWRAVREVEPAAAGEDSMAGVVEGDLVERLARAGLADVRGASLPACAHYADFDDFWEPFTYAVGPAGRYLVSLPPAAQQEIREVCRTMLPSGRFTLEARAWGARGTVRDRA
jgi:SAM-dependent methyltransferase